MQEEVNEKTISLCIKGGKITAQILKAALIKLLAEMDKKKQRGKGEKSQCKKTGRQSIKSLQKSGAQITNIVVTDNNIKSFDRVARKYGIDYSLKKVEQEGKSEYLVFFKAKDVDVMTAAFKEYTSETLKKQKRESVRQKLEKVKEEQMEGLMAIYTSKLWLRHIQLSNAKTTISSLKFQSVQLMQQLDVRFKCQQYMAMLN